MLRLIGFLLLAVPGAVSATDFGCRNEKAEIRCADGACEIETDAFTPMGLGHHKGLISVCAYSGCWEGPVLVRRTRGHLELLYAEIRRKDEPSERIAVIYDSHARAASMNWLGFHNLMECSSQN
jgi:hypothetical protein